MKKIFNWLIALPFMLLAAACSQPEDIVFDHEKPAFETKDGQILLEVIVPSTTKADDVIYISGAFNGGDEVAAADVTWHLEKSTINDKKWGIYLDPSTFVSGKTLADGYRFVSVREGEERTAKNEAVNRTENPAPGTSTNIYVSHWNMYFYVQPEIQHDGPVVYVDDQTGWAGLAMYAWGDVNDIFGGWPGMLPTGTEVINGKTWKYFDCGEAARGLNLNLIFNDNGGGKQLADYNVTFDQDEYFLVITADGVQTDNSLPEHDGTIRVYVDNQAGWEAVALYQWGDQNDLGGGWPGQQPVGAAQIGGVEYTYFEYAVADVEGKAQNLIFNNNGGGKQTADQPVTFSADIVDHFYVIYGTTDCAPIADPFNREPVTPSEPEPEPTPTPTPSEPVHIYINDQTGWTTFVHYWIDGVYNTEWPGVDLAACESVELDGVTYKGFLVNEAVAGQSAGIIFSNNGSETERLQSSVTFDKDRYYTLTADALTEVVTTPEVRIYIQDEIGMTDLCVHYWNDGGFTTAWPGTHVAGTEDIDGITYKYVVTDPAAYGTSCGMIVTDNGSDTGRAETSVVLDKNRYFKLSSSGLTEIDK